MGDVIGGDGMNSRWHQHLLSVGRWAERPLIHPLSFCLTFWGSFPLIELARTFNFTSPESRLTFSAPTNLFILIKATSCFLYLWFNHIENMRAACFWCVFAGTKSSECADLEHLIKSWWESFIKIVRIDTRKHKSSLFNVVDTHIRLLRGSLLSVDALKWC